MPSHDRHPLPHGRWTRHTPGPGLVLLLGIWLAAAPLTWTYGDAGSWLDARWNDVLAGAVLAAIGAIRLIRPLLPTTTSIVSATLGIWLVIAPFVAGYGFGADSTPATVNDVLVGAAVAVLAVSGRI
jgi:hypothetical protein